MFKVGDLCCWKTEDERSENFIVEFVGSGKDSVAFYPEYSKYRAEADTVVLWKSKDNHFSRYEWTLAKNVRKVTKLEQVLK